MNVKEMMVFTLFGFCYFLLFHQGKGDEKIVVNEDIHASEHSIMTIKNAFGDIFDCVDIYRQPAFDHSLLVNHTIQMKPSFLPQGIPENSTSEYLSSQVANMEEKCPSGYVPIMRIPKKTMSNFKANDIMNVHLSNIKAAGVSYVADITMVPGEYYGSVAELDIFGIPQVSAHQFSSSAIWVTNDGDGARYQFNSIWAGWIVHPSLFGDTRSRLFIYWTADGFQHTGCFNLFCPGFVQVHPGIPLGGVLDPVSTYNGTQYVIKILIIKDVKTENWWMVMGEDLNEFVGYWPKSMFNSLSSHANGIRWGGNVYTPNGKKGPPMGSGHFPIEGYRKACFYDRVRLVLKGNVYGDIGENDMLYYESPCYGIGKFKKMQFGRFFHFGGPGGC